MNASKKTSVLVADDDPRLLKLVQRNLELNGYRVLTAMDGTKIMYSADNQMKFDPFDLPAAHVFKVGADGKVHEIEAMGFRADLDSPSGWEESAG